MLRSVCFVWVEVVLLEFLLISIEEVLIEIECVLKEVNIKDDMVRYNLVV